MQEMLQFSLQNDDGDDAQGGQILLKINPEMRRQKGQERAREGGIYEAYLNRNCVKLLS